MDILFKKTYLYQNLSAAGLYTPLALLNRDINNNDIVLKIKTNRFAYIEAYERSEYMERIITWFDVPSYEFLIEAHLKILINELDDTYFASKHFQTLTFIILNLQKEYIIHQNESASWGIQKDLKTLDSEKEKLVQVLQKYFTNYKTGSYCASNKLSNIQFNFQNEKITISNFFLIDDLLSIFIKEFSSDKEGEKKWTKSILEHYQGFNVEKLEKKFRIKIIKELYQFLLDAEIFMDDNQNLKNLPFKIINIIFSLASIYVCSDVSVYHSKIKFSQLYSQNGIKTLKNWLNRQ
ncbi:MAG: hypothetical protein K0M63_07335 [Weeksellaceae bacterium]|nr:hypothetical protein [Weeksellaceae bacterium]